MTDHANRLQARVDELEAQTRRAFDDAQRQADALFSQYQLSQLLASGGGPSELGSAVVVELTRLTGAAAGAIWLGDASQPGIVRISASGAFEEPPPETFDGVDGARRWADGRPELTLLVLSDEPPATVLVLGSGGSALDADGLRIILLARHEIAVAFGGTRLREVLERERAELGAVVDGTTDVIVQVDGDRRVTRLNLAGERALGISAGTAAGQTCADLLGCAVVGDHADDGCPFGEVLASGQAIEYREAAIRGSDGTKLRVGGSYSRSFGDGTAIRATAILRDVTAVRALEQLREGFVATVSHELRTPLALVRGYSETLLHLELDPTDQRRYIEHIHQVSARLTDLVTQILDVTHLDANPLNLERAPASFLALVARLRGDLAMSGEDARLVSNVTQDLPPIEVDAGRVGRVLDNLVANALKYAPPDSPVVIDAAAEGEWLVVTIDDEGIGVPEAERAIVLEPFHRAWNVRESRIPGTGLGLYICRRLVEAHGGRLSIGDRADGQPGTRVTFTLPLLPGRHRPVPATPASPPAGASEAIAPAADAAEAVAPEAAARG
jgi:signal transduction histidine kinase